MKTRLKTLCLWWGLASGILFIICGIVVVCLFTPLVNAIIESKLTLVKDSEVLDAWIRPPIKPILKIHYFNVTNGEEYLSGGKLRVQEVGPYVYEEKWERVNVSWSADQSEVSYNLKKSYHYRPDLSTGSLDDPLVLPNVPMFGMLSKLRNTGPDVLDSGNVFLEAHEPPQGVFEKTTVEEITWGYNHSLVSLANLFLSPEEKLPELYGYFYGKNDTLGGQFVVKTGSKNVLDLGSIVKFENKSRMTTWFSSDDGQQCDDIRGTDGTVFPPFIEKDQVFQIYNKDMCRSLPIEYQETVKHFGLDTYRFVPARTAFTKDDSSCFCPPGIQSCAPEGMFNVSSCHGGSPMLLSWPHFYKADPKLLNQIDGLNPDKDKHEFHVDILPQLGVGLRAAVRLQINIFIEVDGVAKLKNASDVFVPIIWFEDGVEELDDEETVSLLRSATVEPALIKDVLYPILFAVGIVASIIFSLMLILSIRKQRSNNFLSDDIQMVTNPGKL